MESSITQKNHIPDALVYEMSGGTPIYYYGYKSCLNGNAPPEELMGSGYLQVFVIMAIIKRLLSELPEDCQVFTNEMGVVLKKDNWRALDIAIYRKDALKHIPLENKYLHIPPEVAIEIDTKADLKNFTTAMDYVYEKTDDLLDFGVQKVIWVFTRSKKTMIAAKGEPWITIGWDETVQVMAGVALNLAELTKVHP